MPLSPLFDYELSLLPLKTRYLLGIDEVGRGPWAGPVSIGAFLLDLTTFVPEEFIKLKIRDSKLLSPLQREKIYQYFRLHDYKFACFSSPSSEIDRLGISQSINKLIHSALCHFQGSFDFALIDGTINLSHPSSRSVISADRDCFSVASASICAKFTRDSHMDVFDRLYPQYGFKKHKGYGTADHLAALKKFGPCPIHRFSYKPIQRLLLPKR